MVKKINGEAPFQVLSNSFAIHSDVEFTLQYSADGINYTDWSASTPKGENCVVNNVANGMYFKLKNNEGDATITYENGYRFINN